MRVDSELYFYNLNLLLLISKFNSVFRIAATNLTLLLCHLKLCYIDIVYTHRYFELIMMIRSAQAEYRSTKKTISNYFIIIKICIYLYVC